MVIARFSAMGVAEPQGSKRVVPTGKGHRAIAVNGARLDFWRTCIAGAAVEWRGRQEGDARFAGPVIVVATFKLRPPTTLAKRDAGQWVHKRPDVDKLGRALLDALTTSGLFGDDAQVAVLVVRKRYALPVEGLGVDVEVRALERLWEQTELF